MNEVDKKVAIITGCSSGIGLSTAVEFSKNNFITYPTMRNLAKKNELENQLTNSNLDNILQLDVTDDTSITNTISKIKNKHGKIDILVNNAGYGLFGSFEDASIEQFKQQMETDFFGAVRLMKEIIPIMKENKSGKIINVSSVAGLTGFPIMTSYISSKFALEGLTESLRYELKKFGIQLTLIEPGAVKTKFFENKLVVENSLKNPDYSKTTMNILNLTKTILENAISPEIIAKKIVKISNMETISPRYLIGQDSEQIINQKKLLSSSDYEDYILNFMLKDIVE